MLESVLHYFNKGKRYFLALNFCNFVTFVFNLYFLSLPSSIFTTLIIPLDFFFVHITDVKFKVKNIPKILNDKKIKNFLPTKFF